MIEEHLYENHKNQGTKLTMSKAIVLISISTLFYVSQIFPYEAEAASSVTKFKASSRGLAKVANTTCDPNVLDTCVTTLMVFGRRGVYLPKNYPEMVPHCQEEFDAEDCIRNYARKCSAPFERQLIGMLILGAGQVLRKRCGTEGTKEYLTHYQCINSNIEELHDAMDQLIYTMMEISQMTNNDVKIPSACCSFARFMELADKIVRSGCSSYDKTAEHYIGVKMIKGYVSDLLDLSCHGYESGGEKCKKVTLPTGGFILASNNTMVRIPGAKLPPNKPNSIVLPFLNIFTNL